MDIIQQLTDSLGVSDNQAKGGVGLLLKLASKHLPADALSGVKDAIPDTSSLIAEAPEESGGLMGAVGGLMSGFGGKAAAAGGIASLMQGFSKLDLDGDMVAKFSSIVVAFIREKAGDEIADKLDRKSVV